jgi:hypothetical protein
MEPVPSWRWRTANAAFFNSPNTWFSNWHRRLIQSFFLVLCIVIQLCNVNQENAHFSNQCINVPIVYKSRSLNLLDPSRPRRPVSGLLYLTLPYLTVLGVFYKFRTLCVHHQEDRLYMQYFLWYVCLWYTIKI